MRFRRETNFFGPHSLLPFASQGQLSAIWKESVTGKHRNERFRPGYAVVRIDEYDIPGIPKNQLITVKEVWLSREQADAEVAGLNAGNADKSYRYLTYSPKASAKPDLRASPSDVPGWHASPFA